jgi:signal transduction histidine kinase
MDSDKLIQAFINILGNCLRYAESQVTISAQSGRQFVDIVVRDDGEGFQADEAENIFKRFFMGKKGNTGLGLAITKTIVEKHNGTIEAFNGDNGGAVFVVRLPCKGIK